jgi:nicotinate dehydrogenase subunit A
MPEADDRQADDASENRGLSMSGGLSLMVNGKNYELDIPLTIPLLDVLRNHLGLKGSRYGCGLEQCGACMVLIDGSAEYSCSREVGTLEGRSIITVEGLGSAEALHPLQQAFLDEQAGQCGYCLSGILIAAKAFLDRNPDPTRAEVAEALDPNLCRCGSHPRILRAVLKAAAVLRHEASL